MLPKPLDLNKPIVKIIVAGSRNLDSMEERIVAGMSKIVGHLENAGNNVVIVNGLASKGPDRHGGVLADKLGLWQIFMPADWDTYPGYAGHLRNGEMAEEGHMLALFWDGESKGSSSMFSFAMLGGLRVNEFEIRGDKVNVNIRAQGTKRWM